MPLTSTNVEFLACPAIRHQPVGEENVVSVAVVQAWVRAHARALPSERHEPGPALPASLTEARVVGLASAVRSARELIVATHVLLGALVTEAGFRAVMIEGCDAVAGSLDRYVRTGEGDPTALLAAGQGFVRFREVLSVVERLRRWTLDHPDDPVSIVHDHGRPRPAAGTLPEVEQMLARRDLEWLAATGQPVVHWGGTAHLVAGDPRTVPPDQTHPNAGGLLRRELGEGYGVVGLTVGRGTAPYPVPPPPDDFAEHAFGAVADDAVLLDLAVAAGGPPKVRAWLRRPLRTRMIGPFYDAAHDHDARVDAGPLADALDVVVHVPRFGPATPLVGAA
jgi:erythromycin esterase